MALQAPATARLQTTTASSSSPAAAILSPTTGHVGLRRPFDRFALKSSFFSSSLQLSLLSPPKQKSQATSTKTAAPKFSMRVASKQSYICRDCGYIYNDRTPFEKQPDKYFCPVCGAPKRRFRAYDPPVSKNANDTDVRKARKAQLKRDEAIGKALPIAIVVGVAALAGLYFYLNNGF
ncbi:Rubredoxin-like domain [Macleaya cordata]|uniref:Rubredoxin-like domain n=1 Tax=Macleaya cordata TaxID=56857 RepID=A0A200R3R1_MACCD|nr:Rubredoxin-like domain [Macleaya cordata]